MAGEAKKKTKGEAEKLEQAEAFADRMEAKMRKLGSTGDFLCAPQRLRWRQHSIRAYLGSSPDPEADTVSPAPSTGSDLSKA